MDTSLQYTLFIILAPISILSIAGMIFFTHRYRKREEGRALICLMGVIGGWLLFNTLELLDPGAAGTLFWSKVSYLFITGTPLSWLIFAFAHTGRRSWREPLKLTAMIVPLFVSLLLVWTNDLHYWFWSAYEFIPVGNLLYLKVEHGPAYWILAVYTYGLVFWGAALIVQSYFRSFQLYRQQSIWMLIGALTPILVNCVYIFHLLPDLKKDYTSIAFAVSSATFALALTRYQLFELKPVARTLILERMSDAVLTLDRQERIVDLNPAALKLIELPEQQVIGHPVAEILPGWSGWKSMGISHLEMRQELRLDSPEGIHYYDMRISPVINEESALTGRVIILHDITDLKQSETELRQRTVELEARNAELDAFAHTVAHDLKSPVTAVLGYSHLLQSKRSPVSPQQAERYLRVIDVNSKKIASIIDELLLLASVRRLDEINIEPLDMEKIIAETCQRLDYAIEEAQAEIVHPTAWPTAIGYAPWVEEIWVNYVSNAVKYGGQSEPPIPPRIELGYDPPQNGEEFIRFWVQDNGPGLTPEQQQELFTEFQRLDTVRASGHGLGLWIVLRIVQKLGGQVGVESRPGEGSRFYFTLRSAPCLND